MQTISEIKLHSVVNNVVSEGWLSLPLPSTSHLRQAPRMYSFIAITQAVHGFFSLLTRPSGWTLLKFFHANQFCHIFSVLVCIHLLKFYLHEKLFCYQWTQGNEKSQSLIICLDPFVLEINLNNVYQISIIYDWQLGTSSEKKQQCRLIYIRYFSHIVLSE